MQIHVPNPIRGKKVRINNPKNQKKIKPSLHCQYSIRRDTETGKRVD
jgi:hypothetical protein